MRALYRQVIHLLSTNWQSEAKSNKNGTKKLHSAVKTQFKNHNCLLAA